MVTEFNATLRELTIDWTGAFRLNGQLIGYTVLRDGFFLLSTPTDTSAELVNQPGGKGLLTITLLFLLIVINTIYLAP